jgi:hypothetical protein
MWSAVACHRLGKNLRRGAINLGEACLAQESVSKPARLQKQGDLFGPFDPHPIKRSVNKEERDQKESRSQNVRQIPAGLSS